MKPTVYRVLHYPALVVGTAPTLQGFRQRFPSRAMFKAFVEKMRRDGFAPLQIAGEPGAFGGVMRLPDNTFAAYLSFTEWMRDTKQEAADLEAKLTGPGCQLEGRYMLMIECDASEIGRA
ncbi:MAG: hypothetical protein PHI64_22740 [Zoogloea sp.]|uniref:hypothetical protein n=1 Tax=Zoogloea sp. TaxID=49181 RepID=UPI002624B004|nr:hypothetical protein [Zoogloea sp.]MDD2991759.1 hypothetical protein [Zoogloea sp.]